MSQHPPSIDDFESFYDFDSISILSQHPPSIDDICSLFRIDFIHS